MNPDMRRVAILLMITSSVVISFSGLIVRLLEALPLIMNFYRALFLTCAVTVLLFLRYRRAAIVRVVGVGWPGKTIDTTMLAALEGIDRTVEGQIRRIVPTDQRAARVLHQVGTDNTLLLGLSPAIVYGFSP